MQRLSRQTKHVIRAQAWGALASASSYGVLRPQPGPRCRSTALKLRRAQSHEARPFYGGVHEEVTRDCGRVAPGRWPRVRPGRRWGGRWQRKRRQGRKFCERELHRNAGQHQPIAPEHRKPPRDTWRRLAHGDYVSVHRREVPMRRHQLPECRRLGESKPQRANAASVGAIEPDDTRDDAIGSASRIRARSAARRPRKPRHTATSVTQRRMPNG